MKKNFSILISNASSSRNIGDQAILFSLLQSLREISPDAKITIHCPDHELASECTGLECRETLYSWTVFEKRSNLSRIVRLVELLFGIVLTKMRLSSLVFNPTLKKMLGDYSEADIVILAGGGYLRARPGTTQGLNLLMQLFLVVLPTFFRTPVMTAPISVGPFAYPWQEKITRRILSRLELVATRERNADTYRTKTMNIFSGIDLALMIQADMQKQVRQKPVIGFTLRQWLPPLGQQQLENNLATAFATICGQFPVVVQPIIQVSAPEFNEDDSMATERLTRLLKDKGITVLPAVRPASTIEALATYNKIDVLVGMRCHSILLSAVVRTPFVALSYEPKTVEILKLLNLNQYALTLDRATAHQVTKLLQNAMNHLPDIASEIDQSLTKHIGLYREQWHQVVSELFVKVESMQQHPKIVKTKLAVQKRHL